MRIEQADPLDRGTTRECFEVVRAAAEIDDPLGPPWSLQRLRGWIGYPIDPAETWVCRDERTDAVQGWYFMFMPERENRKHRGHQLGLLVKTAMLDWLAEAEPGITRIVTGNAAINRHMIAINTELGYELLDPQSQSQELSVADALRLG